MKLREWFFQRSPDGAFISLGYRKGQEWVVYCFDVIRGEGARFEMGRDNLKGAWCDFGSLVLELAERDFIGIPQEFLQYLKDLGLLESYCFLPLNGGNNGKRANKLGYQQK